MSACAFFGHSDCYRLDEDMLRRTIEDLIEQGVDTFYVGNHGNFDGAVFSCLLKLKDRYPHISFAVVLAYLPTQKPEYDIYHGYSMYPEIEGGPQRFAIERRNKWMIQASDWCVVQIDRTFGGAYKFARMAKRRGLQVINLGTAVIEGNPRRGKKE